jgi:serine/threonine protein kinase
LDPVVFGRYTLLHRIARGGMAELFLARSEGVAGIARLLVIKVVSGHFSEDPSFTTMFEDEVRIASTLSHPNIGQVIDVGQVGGAYFLAMEHIHGKDLRAILKRCLKRRHTVPPGVAVQIGSKVCSALQHAHEARGIDGKPLGIIHRDVSPSNVMVSFDGQVKLIDFGIAKAENRLTLTMPGTIKGKLRYLSPEQVLAQGIDARSDLFTLGISLWEATVGEHLFGGEQEVQIYEAIAKGRVRSPSAVSPGYPAGLEQILLKALATSPEARYASAREMQLALEQYAAEAGIPLSDIELSRFMHQVFSEEVQAWQQAQQGGGGLCEYLKQTIPDDGSRPALLPDEGSDRSDSARTDVGMNAPGPSPSAEVDPPPRKTILYGELQAPGSFGLPPRPKPSASAEIHAAARPPTGPPRPSASVMVTRDGLLRTGPLPQLDSDPGGRRATVIVDDARVFSGLSACAPSPATAREPVMVGAEGLLAGTTAVDGVTSEGRPTIIAAPTLDDLRPTIAEGGIPSAMIAPLSVSPGGARPLTPIAPTPITPTPITPTPITPSTATGPLPMPLPTPILPKASPDSAPEPVIGRDRLDLEEKKRVRAAPTAEEKPRPRTGDWSHQQTGEVPAGTHPYFREEVLPPRVDRPARGSRTILLLGLGVLLVAGLGVGAWLLLRHRGTPARVPDPGAAAAARKVELQSDPSGATVLLPATGKELGKTPLVIELQPGETRTVEIFLGGHQRQSLVLQANTGRRKVYLVPAQPPPGEPKPEPKAPSTQPASTPAVETKVDPEPAPKPELRRPRKIGAQKKKQQVAPAPKRKSVDILDPFQQ